ncbi:hypothetical protein Tco_0721955 [Tanacetum coccineum]
MRTRSQSCNLNSQQQQAPPAFVEPFDLEEPIENPDPPVVTMDDTRTMAQLLEAPTVGYEDAIVVPEITADNFELKHGLLTLIQRRSSCSHPFFQQDHFYDEVPERPEFQQRFDETFYEAWDRFNDLLRACPHHGFSELHQLDTFYNALNSNDQDSLNSAAGGNFLDKMPRDCLRIIESKSKVRNSRNKPVVAKVSSSTSTPGISSDVAELKDMVKALLLDKKSQAPTPVKAVEESCVTCGGAHSYRNCPATNGNVYRDNIQEYVSQAAAANYNQGNTGYRAPIANQIRPPGFPPVQNNQNNQGTNQNRYNQGNNFNQNRGNNYNQNRGNNYNQGQIYQPPVNQPPVHQAPPYQAPAPQTQGVTKTDFESYVKANDAVMRNMQDQNQNLQNQMTNLTDMLSKFVTSNTASTLGTLPSNTVTDPKEDLKGITTRSGVAYKGPTIPITYSPKVMERETEVTKDTMPPTNKGSTEDVQPLVVPVIHHESISEPENAPVSASMPNQKASIPFPSRRNDERRRLIHANALANFGASIKLIGNPTPYYDPIVSTLSSTLTPFGDSDFLLFEQKADSCLANYDDPTSPEVDPTYYDPDGDILLLEAILNSDPSPPPNQGNYFPETRKDLKICEANNEKSSVNEPPEVELKDLPPHLEYAFLEGNDKLPVIIAKDLKNEEKAALIKVLKSHKRAIAWKLSDIKGIDPEFCTHKILMEEDYEPTVQHQREFDVIIRDQKGAENLAADHLSRLENPHQDKLENKEITETFPLETLGSVALHVDSTPWFADFANYHAGNFIVKGMSSQQKNKFFKECQTLLLITPSCSKSVRSNDRTVCVTAKTLDILKAATMDPPGTSPRKSHRQIVF